MKTKLLFLALLLAATGGSAFGQLVISANLSGVVNAPIDQNGWQSFKVNLTQNITFNFVVAPPAPLPAQSTLRVIFTQDATGGRTVTFASNISNPCTITTTANSTTACQFTFDGTTNTWQGVGGSSGGISSAAVAGNVNSVYASSTCPTPSSGNCFFVNDNLKFTLTASWTNATPTAVTCTSNDCNFVAGTDNGKTCYGFASAGSLIVSVGTLTVTGAQTATCSAGASIAVNPGTFIWYTDDAANLNAAYAAVLALPHCGSLVLPSGYMGIGASIFNQSVPTACTGILNGDAIGVSVVGQGRNITLVVARPDTNFGTNAGLLGSGAAVDYRAFGLTGLGATLSTANKTGIIIGGASTGRDIGVTQISGSGFTTFGFTSQQTSCSLCFADTVGSAAISFNTGSLLPVYVWQVGSTGGGGLSVVAGTGVVSTGGSYVSVSNGISSPNVVNGSYWGTGEVVTNPLSSAGGNGIVMSNANAIYDCTNCAITSNANAASAGIVFTANAKAILRGNTTVSGGATGGALFSSGAGGVVYAEPTVTWSPTTFPNFTGTFQGPVVQAASCTGTATAAATINLFASMNITGTCTSVVTVVGTVPAQLGATGFLSYLNCSSSAGGVNASDGACTVMKNGVATAITCTIGTGTSCRDNTHSVAYLATDIITIQNVTQAATTLANLKGSVLTL